MLSIPGSLIKTHSHLHDDPSKKEREKEGGRIRKKSVRVAVNKDQLILAIHDRLSIPWMDMPLKRKDKKKKKKKVAVVGYKTKKAMDKVYPDHTMMKQEEVETPLEPTKVMRVLWTTNKKIIPSRLVLPHNPNSSFPNDDDTSRGDDPQKKAMVWVESISMVFL